MSLLGTLQLLLLAGITVATLSSLVISVVIAPVLRHTSAAEPASRHRALALTGFSPLVLGLVARIALAKGGVRERRPQPSNGA
jgi:hypothetical protein